jgi:hypothetical protein
MAEPLHGAVVAQALTLAEEGELDAQAAADRLVVAAGNDRSALVEARADLLQRLQEDPDNASVNRALTILNLTVGEDGLEGEAGPRGDPS